MYNGKYTSYNGKYTSHKLEYTSVKWKYTFYNRKYTFYNRKYIFYNEKYILYQLREMINDNPLEIKWIFGVAAIWLLMKCFLFPLFIRQIFAKIWRMWGTREFNQLLQTLNRYAVFVMYWAGCFVTNVHSLCEYENI